MAMQFDTYTIVLIVFLLVAFMTFPVLFFIVAPYGRHTRKGFGPTLPPTLGWVLMEAPSPLGMALLFWLSPQPKELTHWVLLFIWQTHYAHRAFIFPFRRKSSQFGMPLTIVASGFLFNVFNAYLNGYYLFFMQPAHLASLNWFLDVRFVLGTAFFALGYFVNQHADHILFHLRKPGETGYKIPQGGMYRWISCPNYFGEMVEWFGWALLSFSPAGLAFALWTMANLLPRAIAHHRWYKQTFTEYPQERKAVLPFIL